MLKFREITEENLKEIIMLTVSEEQIKFVAPNLNSIALAYAVNNGDKTIAKPFGVYHENTPVGFVMIGYDVEPKEYFVWRLMVDKEHQKKGFGKKTLLKALEYIRTKPFGDSKTIAITYEPENTFAEKLYLSVGFCDINEMLDGEKVLKMDL